MHGDIETSVAVLQKALVRAGKVVCYRAELMQLACSKKMQYLGTYTCCTTHLNLYAETNIHQCKYLKSIESPKQVILKP